MNSIQASQQLRLRGASGVKIGGGVVNITTNGPVNLTGQVGRSVNLTGQVGRSVNLTGQVGRSVNLTGQVGRS